MVDEYMNDSMKENQRGWCEQPWMMRKEEANNEKRSRQVM